MGLVEVAMPRTRHSGAPTEVIGRYKRRTDEVDRLVTTAYVQGVSTRDMTRSIGAFPDRNSALRLATAVALETAQVWSARRYLDMSLLKTEQPKVVAA